MKMENCYHLLGPFKYVQPGEVVRSWWMPHMPAVVDMIKKNIWGPTPLPPPPCSTILRYNRQTDVCRSPASTENCLCAKLPSGWGILFIRWTSPIMFLSPSVLLEFFFNPNNRDSSAKQQTGTALRTCLLLHKKACMCLKCHLWCNIYYIHTLNIKLSKLQEKKRLFILGMRNYKWLWSNIKSPTLY